MEVKDLFTATDQTIIDEGDTISKKLEDSERQIQEWRRKLSSNAFDGKSDGREELRTKIADQEDWAAGARHRLQELETRVSAIIRDRSADRLSAGEEKYRGVPAEADLRYDLLVDRLALAIQIAESISGPVDLSRFNFLFFGEKPKYLRTLEVKVMEARSKRVASLVEIRDQLRSEMSFLKQLDPEREARRLLHLPAGPVSSKVNP